jgi:hypothetical protein
LGDRRLRLGHLPGRHRGAGGGEDALRGHGLRHRLRLRLRLDYSRRDLLGHGGLVFGDGRYGFGGSGRSRHRLGHCRLD